MSDFIFPFLKTGSVSSVIKTTGTSLAVQWLRLHVLNTDGSGSVPGGEAKILYAAQHSQKINK